tara:strand:- start:1926 stop:2657 length:732 start_codon:yes stop_codon:yes gene_type:complete
MFESIIEFSAAKEYIENSEETHPIPIKNNIPDWFKKLKHTKESMTIKGCMPFLDTLTSGYLLKMPVDYHIKHNIEFEGKKCSGMQTGRGGRNEYNLNYNGGDDYHATAQLGSSPLVEKNKNQPFHKILNPWFIKTPPGYSTLFVPPLNNTDDRFSIIPGIVDTDTFKNNVNFPFTVNGDKYEILETTISLGTPYVQLIPFKRDQWKMQIKERSIKKRRIEEFFAMKYVINNYKKIFWSKKSWK